MQELERSHEGYGETVKRLMQQVDQDPELGSGVRGTLGDLIRVEQNYELAIETALGPAIQNIVTDREETASRLIAHLKATRAGRATFLPLASIHGRDLEQNLIHKLSGMPGYIGPASDLVRSDPDLRSIITFLLGRVVIADQLEHAVQMARRIQYGCRIVTLEGDVINPGGSMTGGYNRQTGSGVLGRIREIEQLQQSLSDLQQIISERAAKIVLAEQDLKEIDRDLASLEQSLLEQSHLRIQIGRAHV